MEKRLIKFGGKKNENLVLLVLLVLKVLIYQPNQAYTGKRGTKTIKDKQGQTRTNEDNEDRKDKDNGICVGGFAMIAAKLLQKAAVFDRRADKFQTLNAGHYGKLIQTLRAKAVELREKSEGKV